MLLCFAAQPAPLFSDRLPDEVIPPVASEATDGVGVRRSSKEKRPIKILLDQRKEKQRHGGTRYSVPNMVRKQRGVRGLWGPSRVVITTLAPSVICRFPRHKNPANATSIVVVDLMGISRRRSSTYLFSATWLAHHRHYRAGSSSSSVPTLLH